MVFWFIFYQFQFFRYDSFRITNAFFQWACFNFFNFWLLLLFRACSFESSLPTNRHFFLNFYLLLNLLRLTISRCTVTFDLEIFLLYNFCHKIIKIANFVQRSYQKCLNFIFFVLNQMSFILFYNLFANWIRIVKMVFGLNNIVDQRINPLLRVVDS